MSNQLEISRISTRPFPLPYFTTAFIDYLSLTRSRLPDCLKKGSSIFCDDMKFLFLYCLLIDQFTPDSKGSSTGFDEGSCVLEVHTTCRNEKNLWQWGPQGLDIFRAS
jgi:hypothetical protein